MSVTRPGRRIDSAEALAEAMGTFVPSPQQWAAISAPLQPAVVIAGAGSGKTAVMAARVVYLVLTGQVEPHEILGLTFTNKAAAELRARVRKALTAAGVLGPSALRDRAAEESDVLLEPTVATYNAYAGALLTDYGLWIGHEPDTRLLADASRYQLAARVVERFTGPVEQLSDHPPTVIQNLLALDGELAEHLVTPEQVRLEDAQARRGFEAALAAEIAGKNRKGHREACLNGISAIDRRGEALNLVEAYRAAKSDLGLMDFSDQIARAAALASAHPEVGAAERGRFRVVLLDEYQDTSVAQATLLSRLFSGDTVETGRGHPVMAVGDPNQAIYGWRGASVSNILEFDRSFPATDGIEIGTYPLTINRRSGARILQTANQIAAPLYAELAERGGVGAQVRPLDPDPDQGRGAVDVRVFETVAEEMTWLAAAVQQARASSVAGHWSDIAVLTRDNAQAALAFDALSAAGVPVEIVGVARMLRLPEIAEVVATLQLLQDVTANPALVTLLTGARWAIGPRDLRLLAQRAVSLSGRRPEEAATLVDQLLGISDGVDPAELPALSDALADPGEAAEFGYSEEARSRFALIAGELRRLRRFLGEPVLDLVRRIIEVTGVELELASSASPTAVARRENLDLFVRAVAEFQAIDGTVTVAALLAYLTAEDEFGNGLDLASPTAADSVKLLTVHRSKGLEWETVFVVGVCEQKFPSTRSRPLWVTTPAVLPTALRGDAADLPVLRGYDKEAIAAYREEVRDHGLGEERRLGYVAFTRAAQRLFLSGHLWAQRVTPLGPSPYLQTARDVAARWGQESVWLEKPPSGSANPLTAEQEPALWPPAERGEEVGERRIAAALVRAVDPEAADDGLDMLEAATVASWDAELDVLLRELERRERQQLEVLPAVMSATALSSYRADPERFLAERVRPMPTAPSRAQSFGTRFHAWVEARFGQQSLVEPDDLPGRADLDIGSDDELEALMAAFEAGPFAQRAPAAVEVPFAMVLGEQVVRGRIDAVFAEPDGRWLVIDWKTGAPGSADPLQLAIYRLAWAELQGIAPDAVEAAFHYVRSGETVPAEELPGREDLIRLLVEPGSGVVNSPD